MISSDSEFIDLEHLQYGKAELSSERCLPFHTYYIPKHVHQRDAFDFEHDTGLLIVMELVKDDTVYVLHRGKSSIPTRQV